MDDRGILIVRPGSVFPKLKEDIGDFDDWVIHASQFPERCFDVRDPSLEPLPEVDAFRAVIVTGSLHSIYDELRWKGGLERLIRNATTLSIPLLGICFGAQAIATVFGGDVRSRLGERRIGTVTTRQTGGDSCPILTELPQAFCAQTSHQDEIVSLPSTAKTFLVGTDGSIDGFSIGSSTWGLQFHPEVTSELMQKIMIFRRNLEGRASEQDVDLELVHESPYAAQSLKNFFDLV